MELRITIRQQRMYNRQNQEIYWQGTNPSNLNPVQGQLPAGDPRRWPQYPGWIDVTDQVSDLHKLKLSWSDQRDTDGNLTGETQIQKGTSGVLTFEGEAYRLIRKWLIEDVSAQINGVEVIIEHKGIGRYTGYCIKYSDIDWCEGDVCTIDLNLKQMDERVACIKKTMIADNHKGWFPNKGETIAATKRHPRFSYCKENTSGMLTIVWFLAISTYSSMYVFMWLFVNTVGVIVNLLNAIIKALQAIGIGSSWKEINFPTMADINEAWGNMMAEASGCGREHPAPLIRDYISNVCEKCGITVNDQSAPLFFAPNTQWHTSDPYAGNNGVYNGHNPYYNACYYNPSVKRGIRRYRKFTGIVQAFENTTDYWIPDNSPVLTLDMFLNQICPVFNAQWMVRKGTLYINRKDWFTEAQPLFDFRKNGKDRDKILEGVCFENSEKKYPAWCKGIWSADPSDMCGTEAGGSNGTGQANQLLEYESIEDNPAYEGVDDKTTVFFGAAAFRFDGTKEDYIYNAAQNTANAGIVFAMSAGFLTGGTFVYRTIIRDTLTEIDTNSAYAILMSGETCALPKIIIWDGESFNGARAVRPYQNGYASLEQRPRPSTNLYYNKGRNTPGGQPTSGRSWHHFHDINYQVDGRAIGWGQQSRDTYEVVAAWDRRPIATYAANLVNYPMYFEPNFRETLWDRFHWVDDPRRSLTMNRNWSVKLELCRDVLDTLKVFNGGYEVLLNQTVLVDHGFYNIGRIREITVSYDPEDTYGRYVELRGTL